MESSERAKVRRGLDDLKPYLESFVLQHALSPRVPRSKDTAGLLKTLVADWDTSHAPHLPRVARSYAHELLDVRNRWAHEEPFSPTDAARALDTVNQLARALGAPVANSAPLAVARRTTSTGQLKVLSQRATMREIYARVRRDADAAVAEYAAAERAGTVLRKGTKSGLNPEEYAKALLADGLNKGWLT